MSYAAWNVRGLNKRSHQKEVLSFLNSNHLSFVGLLETKVKSMNVCKVVSKLKKNWQWYVNHFDHYNGRIMLGWDESIWAINIIETSSQYVTCEAIYRAANFKILVTFVYAFNDGSERTPLWDYLSSFNHNLPWCICGDFNTVLSVNEILGGREHWTPEMQQFRDCVTSSGLAELRTNGDLYTWTNRRPHDSVLKRLDRVLVNSDWLRNFGSSQVFVKPRGLMDHSPLIIHVSDHVEKISKGFQFFNYMANLEGFKEAVVEAWSDRLYGDPMAIFWRKLKGVRARLVALNKKHGNVRSVVAQCREHLVDTQQSLSLDPRNPVLMDAEHKAILALERALEDEESLYQQKSRCKWLKLGDANSSFFFNQTRSNWNANKILTLVDEGGEFVRGHEAVSEVAVGFFCGTLGSNANLADFDWATLTCPTVDPSFVEDLIKPITNECILATLKSLKPNKAPGPDGFNKEFFIATWDILGPDFCEAVKSFFATSTMHKGVNSTLIALVPKVRTPSSMRDFRPISLCSTMYKCISKILASRLKVIMPSLIDKAQSAFVPGRQISDNILLAQELFRGYGRETGLPKCALKLDLHKAFDSIGWDFLIKALHHMQFPTQFVKWIQGCICSTYFSVKVNGAAMGHFQGAKGLRQGDPLSPYLFTLAMNVFSALLNKIPPSFKYHWKCKDLRLTHLFFADDVLMFTRGDKDSISHIMDTMRTFASISGLSANLLKSQCFFNNCDSALLTWFDNTYAIPHGCLPVKFLGVPLISKQLCIGDCMPLIERITDRINCWTTLLLSLAGRVQLLRSVLYAMISFWSRHFILPLGVHRLLQSLLTRFLWKGDTSSIGGAKVAWKDVCLPIEEGGLGLPNPLDWNRAQIMYYVWLIINKDESSLWSRWVLSTVLKNKPFWIITTPFDCSWIWRQILALRDEVLSHISYDIGRGDSISLWFDPWCHSSTLATGLSDPIIGYSYSNPGARVSDIIVEGSWCLPQPNPNQRRPSERFERWRQDFHYPSVNSGRNDKLLWEGRACPLVNVRWIWDSIRRRTAVTPWWKAVWFKHGIPRFRTHSWLLCLGRLGTLDRLDNWNITDTTLCYLCVGGVESHNHLFLHCPYASFTLGHLLHSITSITIPPSWAWTDLLLGLFALENPTRRLLALLAVQIFAYHIWRERNARRHGKGVFGPRLLLHGIITDLRARVLTEPWFTTAMTYDPQLISCISYFE